MLKKFCEQNLKHVNNKESFKTLCVVSAVNPCVEPASQKFKKDWSIQKKTYLVAIKRLRLKTKTIYVVLENGTFHILLSKD